MKKEILFLMFILSISLSSAQGLIPPTTGGNITINQIIVNSSNISHNDLGGLQGGKSPDEYYHLNLSIYTEVIKDALNWVTGSEGDNLWCKLTGCNMTGNLTTKNITFDYALGNIGNTTLGYGAETIKELMDDTLNRGVFDFINVTQNVNCSVNWTAGEIYSSDTNLIIDINAGSVTLIDNSINYLKWVSGTTLISSLTFPENDEVAIALINCQSNNIYNILIVRNSKEADSAQGRAIADIFPSIIISGLIVSEDTNVTSPWDVILSAGTYYLAGFERKIVSQVTTRTDNMTIWYKIDSENYTSYQSSEVNYTHWDNNGVLTEVSSPKYYRHNLFVVGDDLHFIMATVEHNTLAQAIEGDCPLRPSGLTNNPRSTCLILKGSDTALPIVGSDQWIDVRPTAGTSPAGATITDHGNLIGLADDDHTQYLLTDGSRNMSGDLVMDGNNITFIDYVFANYLGSLLNPIIKLWVTNINVTENISLVNGSINLGASSNPIVQETDNAAWGSTDKALTIQSGLIGAGVGLTLDVKAVAGDYQETVSSTAGVLGYWKFDGDLLDSIGSNNGTASGQAAADGTARIGTFSLDLDGAGDTVTLDNEIDFERTDNFSGEAWIFTRETGNQAIFAKEAASSPFPGYEFFVFDTGGNKLAFHLITPAGTGQMLRVISSQTLALNTWYHVAFTYDGSSSASGAKLYINGVEDTVTVLDNLAAQSILNNIPNEIGARDGVHEFNGLIDEFAVFDVELSGATILEHFNLGMEVRGIVNIINSGSNLVDVKIKGDIYAGENNAELKLIPSVEDGATAVAYTFDTENTLSTAGAIHTNWKNNEVSLMVLDLIGLEIIGNVNITGCYELANGTIIGGSCVSGREYKENEQDLIFNWDDFNSVNPKTWDWKQDSINITKTREEQTYEEVFNKTTNQTELIPNGTIIVEYIEVVNLNTKPEGFVYEDVIINYPDRVNVIDGIKRVIYGFDWVFENRNAIQELKKENDLLKSELCKKDPTYIWC